MRENRSKPGITGKKIFCNWMVAMGEGPVT
jgi:hypothetical protein